MLISTVIYSYEADLIWTDVTSAIYAELNHTSPRCRIRPRQDKELERFAELMQLPLERQAFDELCRNGGIQMYTVTPNRHNGW